MKIRHVKTTLKILALACLFLGNQGFASEVEDLTDMVRHFLANADKQDAHQSFWADDLVYSSSAGLRFGKSEIMDGFSDSDSADDATSEETAVAYAGEEFDVRIYGDAAVVAFRLVGTPENTDEDVQAYFNTGTFIRRNGVWRVVAWQATKIPQA